MTYQPGTPTGTVKLSQDYQNLQNNFTVLNNVFGVDHTFVNDGTAQKGYHKIVHLLNQTVDPSTVATAGQIYAKTATIPAGGDRQLFYKTPAGGVEQISGSQASANGFGWFSGILAQWGFVNSPLIAGTVSFSPNFPTNCFGVFTNIFFTVTAPGSPAIILVKPTTAGFTWSYQGSSGFASGNGFYWYAIGN